MHEQEPLRDLQPTHSLSFSEWLALPSTEDRLHHFLQLDEDVISLLIGLATFDNPISAGNAQEISELSPVVFPPAVEWASKAGYVQISQDPAGKPVYETFPAVRDFVNGPLTAAWNEVRK
jgi:hypothetical protein